MFVRWKNCLKVFMRILRITEFFWITITISISNQMSDTGDGETGIFYKFNLSNKDHLQIFSILNLIFSRNLREGQLKAALRSSLTPEVLKSDHIKDNYDIYL